jgi:uncharacterized OB-fold protein
VKGEGPAPTPDPESAFWWEGLRQERLLLQRCGDCGQPRFPPLPSCPLCASGATDIVEASGRGVVYSFVTAHVPVSPGYEGPLPYTVATVELAEGPRVLGRVDPPAPLAVGAAVSARFLAHATWTELTFTPDGP